MKTLDTHQQLFVITAEECGELTQVCMKILRKATVDDEWNKKLLEEAKYYDECGVGSTTIHALMKEKNNCCYFLKSLDK